MISRRELECVAQPLSAAAVPPDFVGVFPARDSCLQHLIFGKMFFFQKSVTGGDKARGYT